MLNISGKTKILTVIGDPIEHTLSPLLYNSFFSKMDIDAVYLQHRVNKAELKAFLDHMKLFDIFGCGITMPLKHEVLRYIGDTSTSAKGMGVNALKREANLFCAKSTDVNGLIYTVEKNDIASEGKEIVILGAGGVVKPILQALITLGAGRIKILNRNIGNAMEVARFAQGAFGRHIETAGMDVKDIVAAAETCDILINATPLGMQGFPGDFWDFSFINALPKHAVVLDTIYMPIKTNLIKHAEKAGLNTINGLDFLIGSSAVSTDFFFEKKADDPVLRHVRKVVVEELQRRCRQ